MTRPARRLACTGIAAAAVCALLGAGCSGGGGGGSPDLRPLLRFAHGAGSIASHPFPSDEYRDRSGMLAGEGLDGLLTTPNAREALESALSLPSGTLEGGFSAAQVDAAPYLEQVPLAGITAFSANLAIRIPFSFPSEMKRIDISNAADVVFLVSLGPGGAGPDEVVAIGDFRNGLDSNALTFRPLRPLAPGLYTCVVLDVQTRHLSTIGDERVLPSDAYEEIRGDPDGDPVFDSPGLTMIDKFFRAAAVIKSAAGLAENLDLRHTVAYFEFTVGAAKGQVQALVDIVRGDGEFVDPTVASPGLTAVDSSNLGTVDTEAVAGEYFADVVLGGVAGPDETIRDFFLTQLAPAEVTALLGPAADDDTAGTGVAIRDIATGAITPPNFLSDFTEEILSAIDAADPEMAVLLAFKHLAVTGSAIDDDNPILPFDNTGANPPLVSSLDPLRMEHPIPFLAAFPKGVTSDIPVVVFLADFTRGKETLLRIANAICAEGRAVIAIDHYMHGERSAFEGDPLTNTDAMLAAVGAEPGLSIQSDVPDPFFNQLFLERAAGRFYQSLVDHAALVRLIVEADVFDSDFDVAVVDEAYADVTLLGLGLGGMIGTELAAADPDVGCLVANTAGGGLSGILQDSPTLSIPANMNLDEASHACLQAGGEQIAVGPAGCGAADFSPTSSRREAFDQVYDLVLSRVDPIAFGRLALADRRPTLLQLANGDAVFPNDANARLARAMASGADDAGAAFPVFVQGVNDVFFSLNADFPGAPAFPTDDTDPLESFPTSGIAQFDDEHDFLLEGTAPENTTEAQRQVGVFATSCENGAVDTGS